jgi:hypothetical protein
MHREGPRTEQQCAQARLHARHGHAATHAQRVEQLQQARLVRPRKRRSDCRQQAVGQDLDDAGAVVHQGGQQALHAPIEAQLRLEERHILRGIQLALVACTVDGGLQHVAHEGRQSRRSHG